MEENFLFRAKNKTGTWIYGYYMYSERENKHYILGDSKDYGFQKQEIEQFTLGVQFKYRGNKYFNGDIVKHGSASDLFVVIFKDGEFRLQLQNESFIRTQTTASIQHLEFCKIVGNIHDNPELLK
jgi:hypothetical protein